MNSAAQPSIREAISAIWADPRARRYAIFLAVSAFFAFMQDAMLEPFGGDVFGLAWAKRPASTPTGARV